MGSAGKKKKGLSTYILPILFCGLLVVLAVLRNRDTEQPLKAVLQEGEPLTLTDQAIENYLYSDGFLLSGDAVSDENGKKVAILTVNKDENGGVETMILSFPLTKYIPTESDGLAPLKAERDADAQRGETLFLCLFDAVSATDGRVAAKRDSALEKLEKTMDTGKASGQAANSWRFNFSLEPGEIEGTVTILFTLVK